VLIIFGYGPRNIVQITEFFCLKKLKKKNRLLYLSNLQVLDSCDVNALGIGHWEHFWNAKNCFQEKNFHYFFFSLK